MPSRRIGGLRVERARPRFGRGPGLAREMTQRRIALLDDQIGALVYELYGLTEEERGVITGE